MLARIAKWLVWIIAILLIVGAFINWRVSSQLEMAIQKIRNAGDPVTLADLKPTMIASDENAATYLSRIAEDSKKLDYEIWSQRERSEFSWETGLTESQCVKTEEAFAAYPRVLEMLNKASACSISAQSIDVAVSPSQFLEENLTRISQQKTYARIFSHYARCLTARGKPDEAIEVTLRQLHLAGLQEQEPTIVNYMMNLACKEIGLYDLNGVLQTSRVSQETHRLIESGLAKQQPLKALVHAIKSERALAIDLYRMQFGDFMMKWYIGGYLEYVDQQVSMGERPQFEVPPFNPRTSSSTSNVLIKLPASGFEQVRVSSNRLEADLRSLRIINAIYSMTHRGENVDLDLLGLPSEIMIDPINGEPLTIKKTLNGWMVYSVGSDELDGGGSLKDGADFGFGPPVVR